MIVADITTLASLPLFLHSPNGQKNTVCREDRRFLFGGLIVSGNVGADERLDVTGFVGDGFQFR